MPQPPEMRGDMRDANYCLQKAKEYRAKAKETTDADLRIAFEAVAREFELRAKKIAAEDFKPRGAAPGRERISTRRGRVTPPPPRKGKNPLFGGGERGESIRQFRDRDAVF